MRGRRSNEASVQIVAGRSPSSDVVVIASVCTAANRNGMQFPEGGRREEGRVGKPPQTLPERRRRAQSAQ